MTMTERPPTHVGGGVSNTASRIYATIGGGQRDTASEPYGAIGGGGFNSASGYAATVPGDFKQRSGCPFRRREPRKSKP